MIESAEREVLERLDAILRDGSLRLRIDAIVERVEADLAANPAANLAFEPIPLEWYREVLPSGIRSSWVFILRAGVASGAERHPNSRQRMMSYRGGGDFQTRPAGVWHTTPLHSDPAAPLDQRWISIPENVWHQGLVGKQANWAVVSFQTAAVTELIEERPVGGSDDAVRRSHYVSPQASEPDTEESS